MSPRTFAYFVVQSLDAFARQTHEFRIAGQRLGRGIDKVRHQGKVQARVAIGQIPHLQPFQQMLDARGAREHRGHRHQRAMLGRNAVARNPSAATTAG